jgi:hypothetical protein
LTPLKDPAAAKMPAAAAAAASRPIHSSIQSSQSRVSELRNAFVVTLHGPRLRLAQCAGDGDGDVFFSFHIVIQMGLMLDSNAAASWLLAVT